MLFLYLYYNEEVPALDRKPLLVAFNSIAFLIILYICPRVRPRRWCLLRDTTIEAVATIEKVHIDRMHSSSFPFIPKAANHHTNPIPISLRKSPAEHDFINSAKIERVMTFAPCKKRSRPVFFHDSICAKHGIYI